MMNQFSLTFNFKNATKPLPSLKLNIKLSFEKYTLFIEFVQFLIVRNERGN